MKPRLARRLTLAVLVAIVASAFGTAPAAARRSLHFGINANTAGWGAEVGLEQDRVARTGLRWLREDLEWTKVEPADDAWDWSFYDRLFRTAAQRQLRILPVLDSSPCWAVPSDTDPADCWMTYPADDADYAEFTARVAARYGPGGRFWQAHPGLDGALAPEYLEVWNEPYYPQFSNGEVSPGRYARLYKAAVVAGRQANPSTRYLVEANYDVYDVDPEHPGWVYWADGMVREVPDLGDYVDGIAIHPYPGGHHPDYQPVNSTDASFRNTDRIHERFASLGIERPIWITEVGYSSCDDPEGCVPGDTTAAREQRKAAWLGILLDELGRNRYGYVHAVFLYAFRQWKDPAQPDDDAVGWFGIVDAEGDPLPAYRTFVDAIAANAGVPRPLTFISSKSVSGSRATFGFRSNDPTATFRCRLDADTWSSCTSPVTYRYLDEGRHTFRVRAVNVEGRDVSPATVTVTIP